MGDTIEEALAHARVALGEWIAHSRASGMSVPEPRTADELLAIFAPLSLFDSFGTICSVEHSKNEGFPIQLVQ